MGKRATLLSLVLCVLLFTPADRSFSRARGPQTPAEQQRWIQEQQRKAEQQRLQNEEKRKTAQNDARKIQEEYSDEAWQEALGATTEQWKAIKPRLEEVKKAERAPTISLSVYGFGGGGNSYSDSYSNASGSSGGAGVGGGFASGGGGGSEGLGGGGAYSASGGSGGAGPIGPSSGVRASGGASGGGGSFSSGAAAAGGASGYGFGFGGPPGPVKKNVGDVSLGWQWRRPSLNEDPNQLSENEKICEQLLDVLETKSPDPEQVRRRVEALRKVREQVEAKRREARQQLREVVTPVQEAKLILMGYLE
jgi:hypothetical protein